MFVQKLKSEAVSTYSVMLSSGEKNILLWGSDELAELCLIASNGLPLNIVGVVSLNGKREFYNCRVYSKDDIKNMAFDAILVATFDEKEIAEIKI